MDISSLFRCRISCSFIHYFLHFVNICYHFLELFTLEFVILLAIRSKHPKNAVAHMGATTSGHQQDDKRKLAFLQLFSSIF